MNNYLITLTPVNKFFFGGEMTFQVGDNKNDMFNEQYSSYIIKSNLFPQQTSLLGMLRFLLLRNSPYFDGEKITDTDKVADLIGETSFIVKNDGHGKNEFKSIDSISGCFLQYRKEGSDWTDLSFSSFNSHFVVGSFMETGLYNKVKKSIPELKGYNAKDGYTKYVESDKISIPISDIFVKDSRLGINRDIDTGKVNDSAFFKQICYRFADKSYMYDENGKRRKDQDNKDIGESCQFRFAFKASILDDVKDWKLTEYGGQLVSVGGDNSQFIIGIKPLPTSEKKPEADEQKEKEVTNVIILQSPAYLMRDEVDNAYFAITEVVPFLFLKTTVAGTDSYSILNKDITRSVQYQLYERGSVFYFSTTEAKEKFVEALNSKSEFVQIGYNQYLE